MKPAPSSCCVDEVVLLLQGVPSTLGRMSSRLSILAVLLLCICGFAPSIWACAAMEQHRDCCPPEQAPCDTGEAPLSTGVTVPACCTAQVAPTQAEASLRVEKEHALSSDPPTDAWRSFLPPASPRLLLSVRSPLRVYLLAGSHQQQIYLQTGRLRL